MSWRQRFETAEASDSGSSDNSGEAQDSHTHRRCLHCRCAELWEQTADTTNLEDFAVAPAFRVAASQTAADRSITGFEKKRIEAAKALYNPLYRWQFRLLRVHPSKSRTTPLSCDLVLADMIEPLKKCPGVGLAETGEVVEYEAISYTWGTSDFSAAINCNGVDLPVTPNAHTALTYMRLVDRPRVVWIDSICINQLDIEEKNRQVQDHMFRIFRRAKSIVGYLDRPHEKCIRTVRFLEALDRLDDSEKMVEMGHCRSPTHRSANKTRYTISNGAGELLQLCSFFRRMWIRQEVFAAQASRNLFLQTAGHMFKWDVLQFALGFGTTSRDEDVLQARRCFKTLSKPLNIQDFEYTEYDSSDEEPDEILDKNRLDQKSIWPILILQNTDGFQSSLAVDRIYAMYNIAAELEALPDGLPLDYKLPFREAYIQFFDFLGQTEFGIPFFGIFEDLNARANDLPSYLIDIRKEQPRILRQTSLGKFFLCDPDKGLSQDRIENWERSVDLQRYQRVHRLNKDRLEYRQAESAQRLRSKNLPNPPERCSSLMASDAVLLCAIQIGQLGHVMNYEEVKNVHDYNLSTSRYIPYAIPASTIRSSQPFETPQGSPRTIISTIESLSYTWYTMRTKMAIPEDRRKRRFLGRVVLASSIACNGDLIVVSHNMRHDPNPIIIRPTSALCTSYRYLGPCICFDKFEDNKELIPTSGIKAARWMEVAPSLKARPELPMPSDEQSSLDCIYAPLDETSINFDEMPPEYFWLV